MQEFTAHDEIRSRPFVELTSLVTTLVDLRPRPAPGSERFRDM
jgi:hypothetical protein